MPMGWNVTAADVFADRKLIRELRQEVERLSKENEEMSKEITNLKIRILGKVPTIGKRQEFFCHICDADVLGDYGFYERERWYPLCMECARRLEGCVLGEKHVIWKGAVHARPTD